MYFSAASAVLLTFQNFSQLLRALEEREEWKAKCESLEIEMKSFRGRVQTSLNYLSRCCSLFSLHMCAPSVIMRVCARVCVHVQDICRRTF